MEVRDAIEADAAALAAIADAPADVMRNLIHDRTVRVAERDDAPERGPEGKTAPEHLLGFVSFDARNDTIHVTQLGGEPDVCERLLDEPVRFARREGMSVELLLGAEEEALRAAVERAGFRHDGQGPRFEEKETARYRWNG